MRRIRLLAVLLIVSLAGLVSAQSKYPEQQDMYVNDYANVLSVQEETTLRDLLRNLYSTQSIEMTVITVTSFRDYKTVDETFEHFATSLFNTWKIGDSSRNDGILILAAMTERKIRIETGSGYGTDFNDDMKAVIEEFITPDFRRGDYGEGLIDGTHEVIREITGGVSAGSTGSTASTTSAGSGSYRGSDEDTTPLMVAGGATLAVGAGGLAWVVRAMNRRRPRPCLTCGMTMHRLDDYADDAFLTPGQISEERVGSIDYDVWECPGCKTRTVFEYPAFLTRFNQCPQCNHKTLGRSSHVIDHATHYSTGLREITMHCSHCSYTNTWTEVIPMVQRSSSSDSSSSFSSSSSSDSGGSSSGGGASGSW